MTSLKRSADETENQDSLKCSKCSNDNILVLAACGCIYCKKCRDLEQENCGSCQITLNGPDIDLYITKTCKFRERGCDNMAQYLCKCIRDGYLCGSCLTVLHGTRVSATCIPDKIDGHENKKRVICQDCGDFWAEFKINDPPITACFICKSKYSSFEALPDENITMDMENLKKFFHLTTRIMTCKFRKISTILGQRQKVLEKETQKTKEAVQKIETNFADYKKEFESENAQFMKQKDMIRRILSKLEANGPVSRVMNKLTDNSLKVKQEEALLNLFTSFRNENVLYKPIKRAIFKFTSNDNFYQILEASQEIQESQEAKEIGSQDESELVICSPSGKEFTPNQDGLGTDEQYSLENELQVIEKHGHPSQQSLTINLDMSQVSGTSKAQTPMELVIHGNSKSESLVKHEISATQQINSLWFPDHVDKLDDLNRHQTEIKVFHTPEPVKVQVTRLCSPFYIFLEIPELVEARIKILQEIKNHAHQWRPLDRFDYGNYVIVRDSYTQGTPYKRGMIKFIRSHDETVRVTLLDFGFDIMVNSCEVGEIPDLDIGSVENTCFIGKLMGIKPMSNFIFPTGARKCATNYLNSLLKRHGSRVTVSRKYEHEEFTYIQVKQKIDNIEQDWSQLLIMNGYALPNLDNNLCFIPAKDYCYRYHALNDCAFCNRVHECPFCHNRHSLLNCAFFKAKLQEN